MVLLGIFSVLAVYSATGSLAYRRDGNTEFYLFKHSGLLAIGFLLTYACHLLHYMKFNKWSSDPIGGVDPTIGIHHLLWR